MGRRLVAWPSPGGIDTGPLSLSLPVLRRASSFPDMRVDEPHDHQLPLEIKPRGVHDSCHSACLALPSCLPPGPPALARQRPPRTWPRRWPASAWCSTAQTRWTTRCAPTPGCAHEVATGQAGRRKHAHRSDASRFCDGPSAPQPQLPCGPCRAPNPPSFLHPHASPNPTHPAPRPWPSSSRAWRLRARGRASTSSTASTWRCCPWWRSRWARCVWGMEKREGLKIRHRSCTGAQLLRKLSPLRDVSRLVLC